MNGEEVKYLRQNIYLAAAALASLIALMMSLVIESVVLSGILVLAAGASVSFIRALDVNGYNRIIWGSVVTWNNPPVQEQKRVLEDGEEL